MDKQKIIDKMTFQYANIYLQNHDMSTKNSDNIDKLKVKKFTKAIMDFRKIFTECLNEYES